MPDKGLFRVNQMTMEVERHIMNYQNIIYEQIRQTAWIYLNRPKDMNSLTSTMLIELEDVLNKVKNDNNVRVVVLSGKGKAFCAGADLKGVRQYMNDEKSQEFGFFDYLERTFGLLEHYPKPVIAAINGLALAGGLEIAMTADLIIATESAKLGDAHSNFGVFPGAGGAVKLPRRIGANRAKYLLFTGDFLTAAELKDFGLVNQVVPDNELETAVQALADRLSDKSPLVLRRMKEVVRDGLEQPLDIALRHELLVLKDHMQSYDMKEGLSAFTEKRKPEFRGY